MNWMGVLMTAAIGFIMAIAGTFILAGRKPGWSRSRLMLSAALIAPCFVVIGCIIGWLASSPGADEWRDLVTALWLTIGIGGGIASFAGGMLGAFVAQRALRS